MTSLENYEILGYLANSLNMANSISHKQTNKDQNYFCTNECNDKEGFEPRLEILLFSDGGEIYGYWVDCLFYYVKQ